MYKLINIVIYKNIFDYKKSDYARIFLEQMARQAILWSTEMFNDQQVDCDTDKKHHKDYILRILLLVTDCDTNFEHQIAVLASIQRDLKVLFELTQKGQAWCSLLQNVLTLTSFCVDQETIARHQHQLINFTTLEVKKLLTSPSANLTAERIKFLFAVRGLVILWHLDSGNKIPSVLLDQLEVLFKAKSKETNKLIQILSLNIQHLSSLHIEYPPDHKWFKFISTLIKSLEHIEIGPLNHKSKNTGLFILKQSLIDINNAESYVHGQELSQNENTYKPIQDSGDLFRYNLANLNVLYRKEFAGIPNLFKHYHPDELLQCIPNIVMDYLLNQDDVSLAFLLCLFFRCHVSRFHLIALCPAAGSNIWLELGAGFLVWDRQALIKSHNEIEPVKIPLPIEIVQTLTDKLQKFPNARTLGDLFGDDLPILKKEVRRFTFIDPISSHRPFVTRLHFSYGRFILSLCKDEVYAAAIAIDFSLGVTANFNYIALEPARINEICETTYKQLGFSGEFLNPVISIVGSDQGQRIDEIVNLLNRELKTAQISFVAVHNRFTLDQLISVHNQIVFSLTLLLAVTCGLRKAGRYSICNHTLDVKNGLMLIHDKASTEYLTSRLVPIPELTLQWLLFYKNWLKSLAQRMSNKSKKFSVDIASICADECSLGSIPFLFYFHRNQMSPIGSKHIQLMIKKSGLETNLGRHFLDRILRNTLGSVLLNAHAGRANLGQESFGMRSALSVTDAMRELKVVMDKELASLNILLPPNKEPVRYLSPILTKTYLLSARQKPVKKKKQFEIGERCPYGEFSLFNASNFEKLITYWVSTPLKQDFGQLAISLVLMDGVIHEEEVLFAVRELVQGRIFKIENEYFIDVDTPVLGIRRINLSSITLSVLNSIALLTEPVSEIDLKLQAENSVNQLLAGVSTRENNSLITLVKMAEDFYAIRVPGALREWMCGRQHARTLRPETLLRHKLQLKERLSDLGNIKQHAGRIRSNQILIDALNEACDKENNKDSNVLRMKKLASTLEGVDGNFFSLADNVLVQYAWFLSTKCPKIKSPSSVRTHFYVVKPLIQNICLDLDDLEELNVIDWSEVTTDFISTYPEDRNISSVNYLLRLFNQQEIRSLIKDEARASRKYIDYPSSVEIAHAIQLINDAPHLSEYQKLAALMLKLMEHLPLRAEDVAFLRVSDVFIGERSFIVVTSASTGSKKTDNANRVLFLSDPDLTNQLVTLKKNRALLSSVQSNRTSLFGNSEVLKSFEGTEELLFIVADALRCSTGSNFVRPHSLRTKYLSDHFRGALLPQIASLDALRQRNILYELSVNAGHSDPDVSVKNYVCEFNQIRRSWVDRLILREIKLSAHFLTSITSLGFEAARKRLQRKFSVADLSVIFQSDVTPQLKMRIHDLVKSHDMYQFEYELKGKNNPVDNQIQAMQFLACVLLGMNKDAAAAYVNIPKSMPHCIESKLKIFSAYREEEFFTRLRIDFQRFKVGEFFINLAQHFGLWMVDPIQTGQLLKLIPSQAEKPWLVTIKDIPFILEFISPRLQKAGFILTVLIPQTKPIVDGEKISSLNRLGVRRVEKLPRHHFMTRDQLMILFKKSGNADQSNLNQKITNFEINIFMLSFLMKHHIQG